MKVVPIYKNKIISLPLEIINEKLSTATNDELKVLIAVFSRNEFDADSLATEIDVTAKSFNRALKMWQDAGVLTYEENDEQKSAKASKSRKSDAKQDIKADADEKPKKPAKQKKKTSVDMRTSLPHYASEELAEVMTRVKGASALIDSCQQTLGKIFNTAEASSVIALSEQLSLSNEYILLLCSYAASIEKKSVRYILKLATDFYDKDIVTYTELEEEINMIKDRTSNETFVRNLFGIGKRALIKKEKDLIHNWTEKYDFSREMIEKAYEITVARTSDPKISYTNAILDNWYAAGLKTPEDVDKAESERQQKPNDSSFSTDDFFEAALMRSYDNGSKRDSK